MTTYNTKNSTDTPLLNGEIFVGLSQETGDKATISSSVLTDQDGVLYIEQSSDGSNWDLSQSFNVLATVQQSEITVPTYRYARVRFENNSGSDQTYIRLQTIFSKDRTELDLSALATESTLTDCETLLTSIDGKMTFGSNNTISDGLQTVMYGRDSGAILRMLRLTTQGEMEVSIEADNSGIATEATLADCETLLTSIEANTATSGSIYDPQLSLANGDITGAKRVVMQARGQVTTTGRIPGTFPTTYDPLTVAESWEVVSTSAADAGTDIGAQYITVEGIDASGNEQTETVQTNLVDGRTPTAIPGTWLCANKFYVSTAGSHKANVGNMTLQVSGGGALRNYIQADACYAEQMRYRAPIDKALYIRECSALTRDFGVFYNYFIKSYDPVNNTYRNVYEGDVDDYPLPFKMDMGGYRLEPGSEIVLFVILSAGIHEMTFIITADQK